MRRSVTVFLLVILLALGLKLKAQHSASKPAGKTAAKEKGNGGFLLLPGIYLGTDYAGGSIPKKTFDDLLRNGFSAHDSLGNKYNILGFNFTYAERNLYEDSVGNLEVLVDFQSEYCTGDTVTENIARTIYQRIKAGDTVYIDHVTLLPNPGNTALSATDTSVLAGRGMKCIIAK